MLTDTTVQQTATSEYGGHLSIRSFMVDTIHLKGSQETDTGNADHSKIYTLWWRYNDIFFKQEGNGR